MTPDTEHVTNFAARIRAGKHENVTIAIGMIERVNRVLRNPETSHAYLDAALIKRTFEREF